jgi:hypothetical protein
MALLLVGAVFSASTSFAESVILVCGKPAWIFALKLIALSVLICVALVAAPLAGALGVAAATLLANIAHNSIGAVVLARVAPLNRRDYAIAVYAPIAVSLMFWAALACMRLGIPEAPVWILVPLLSVVGAVLYTGGMLLVAPKAVAAAFASLRMLLGRERGSPNSVGNKEEANPEPL